MRCLKAVLVGLVAGYLLMVAVNIIEAVVAPRHVMTLTTILDVSVNGSAFGNNLPDLVVAFFVGFAGTFARSLRRQRQPVA